MAQPPSLSLQEAYDLLKTDVIELMNQLEQLTVKQAKTLAPLMADVLELPKPYNVRRTIKRMLQARPEWVNAPIGPEKLTILMVAIRIGDLDLADVALKSGADLTKKDKESQHVLDHAIGYIANHRFQEVVMDTLLETGKFTRSQKSMFLAKAAREGNLGATRSLLKHGADFSENLQDPNSKNSTLGNALQVACFGPEGAENLMELAEAMLAHPQSQAMIDAGWDNKAFGAPIHCACLSGNSVILSKLLTRGACIEPPANLEETRPRTPLMAAASNVSIECVRMLLAAGANATRVDAQGQNALHHLGGGDSLLTEEDELPYSLPCFQSLIEAGTDLSAVDNEGNTPAEVARRSGRPLLASHMAEFALECSLDTAAPQAKKPRQF